jgi:hypothetical protein
MIWRHISQDKFKLLTEPDTKGLTPIHIAFLSGNLDLIGYFLFEAYEKNKERGLRQLKELKDNHDRNLLHVLFEEALYKPEEYEKVTIVVEKLIELEVDRFAKDDRHRTPLKILISDLAPKNSEKPISIAKSLIHCLTPHEVDRNIMIMFKNDVEDWKDDWRPIQQCMQVPQFFPFLPLFVSQCSIEALQYVDVKGRSIWHYLAIMGAQKSVMDYFRRGQTLTPTTRDVETGVSIPSLESHVIHIRDMVLNVFKALVEREDAKSVTSLEMAFDLEKQSPLHTAAKWNNVVVLREMYVIYGEESQSWKDEQGFTALHCAVNFNNIFALMELHDLKWNLNPEDDKGRTPYALALENKRRHCAELLRAWGAFTGDQEASTLAYLDEDDAVSGVEVIIPAGEAAGRRLSVSLSNIPSFSLDSDTASTSNTFISSTIDEDGEINEEEEETAGDDVVRTTVSTASLMSALNAAKIRDEDAEEETKILKQHLEQLTQELEMKRGEAQELESALNERPSIREHEEMKTQVEKSQHVNMNLKRVVDELRQKVVDLELAVADSKLNSNGDNEQLKHLQQSLSDSEAHIELLNIQLQEARNVVSQAQDEANHSSRDKDMLSQLQRQLDQTQSQLSKQEQDKLATIESLKENEVVVKRLQAELDSLVTTFAEKSSNNPEHVDKELLEEAKVQNDALSRELESTKIDLQLSQANVGEVEAKIANLQTAVTEMQGRILQLEMDETHKAQEMQEIASKLSFAQEKCAKLQTIIDQLEISNNSKSNELQMLKDSTGKDDFELQRQTLLDRLITSENNEEQLRKEQSQLSSQLESHKRERETQSKSLELLEVATGMLKNQEETMKQMLEILQDELEQTKIENVKLIETKETIVSENVERRIGLERAAGEANATADLLKTQLEDARAEIATLHAKSVASNNSTVHVDNTQERSKLERDVVEAQAMVANLKTQLEEAKREYGEIIKAKDLRISEVDKDRIGFERTLIELNTKATSYAELLEEHKRLLQEKNEKLEKARSDAATVQLSLVGLQMQLNESQSNSKRLLGTSSNGDIGYLRTELKSLKDLTSSILGIVVVASLFLFFFLLRNGILSNSEPTMFYS